MNCKVCGKARFRVYPSSQAAFQSCCPEPKRKSKEKVLQARVRCTKCKTYFLIKKTDPKFFCTMNNWCGSEDEGFEYVKCPSCKEKIVTTNLDYYGKRTDVIKLVWRTGRL